MKGFLASDEVRFLRGFLSNPLRVAAPVPSGRKLARTVAAQIDAEPGGYVVELGPGTGAITAAILEQGVAPQNLIAIETDADFARRLRSRFANIHILEGDAFSFRRLIAPVVGNTLLRTVVSGIPVLNRPKEVTQPLLADAIAALEPGAPFVQFSYGAEPPIAPIPGVEVSRVATVWQNLPPMHIWVYRGRHG
ncbi:MAG: phospholipid methyltransferase [Alphaproteobacteria bacterium]|nr:phospholipid methyltransferase [Alphaproteobacteria bacterium]MBV9693406.1 phospholipid methyltransferase [Alphaproteobacteria bacterium]